MIHTIDTIPYRRPISHTIKGGVKLEGKNIRVGDIQIPPGLRSRLRARVANFSSIQEGVNARDLYLRGKVTGSSVKWFGLVTPKFEELTPHAIADVLETKTGDAPIVRYAPGAERFVLSSKVGETDGSELYLCIDSGDFGTYGGNGQMAVRAGFSLHDPATGSWTSFHSPHVAQARVIHRFDKPSLESAVDVILEGASGITARIGASCDVSYKGAALSAYMAQVGNRTSSKRLLARVRSGINGAQVSAADLAEHISLEAQSLSERAQLRLESVAGEVMYHAGSVGEGYVAGQQPAQLGLKF